MTSVINPYSTAKPLFGQLATWVADEMEKNRLAAYQVYENIYWGVPQTFKLASRGEEDNPIYIPSGRVIVETMNRFVAPEARFMPDPAVGTPNDQLLAQQYMDDLCKREKVYSKFNSNRRFGLIRGDWMFYLWADPLRQPGAKVSILTIDPGMVFRITQPDDVDVTIGYHIAEVVANPVDPTKQAVRRTTYMKQTLMGGPSPIDVTDAYYEVDQWGGPGMLEEEAKLIQVASPAQTLPSPIDQLPIYHIPNFQEPNQPYGASEMKGLERVFAAINQSISDEELALAMEGLGCYACDSGTPVDDDGNEVPWNLGPGRVVEVPEGKKFVRVNGVGSVTPNQDHLRYLHEQIDQVFGMGAIAKGRVDVSTAESGVALALELAPLLSHAQEKDQIVTDVMQNMMFDLPKWIVAYEGSIFNALLPVVLGGATSYIMRFGDKVPQNREGKVEELIKIAAVPGVLPATYVRDRLRKLGYDDMPDETVMQAAVQADALQAADVQGVRADQEVTGVLSTDPAAAAEAPEL